MKTLKIILLLILTGSFLQLASQVNPVSIDLRSNGVKLDAKFYPASIADKVPTVILLHGFPGNQTSPLGLAEKLNSAGFNILVFNYQGSYLSEGNFSFDNCIENASAAFNFLADPGNQLQFKIDTSKIVVCGYSFGGTIALESGMYNDKIRNIISIGNDDHSVSLKKVAADSVFRKAYQGYVAKSFGPEGPFRGDLKTQMELYLQNIDRYDLVKNAEKLKNKKVLFVVGWLDKTSFLEINTLPLYRRLQQLKAVNISIKGFETDHQFGNVADDLASAITDWIKKIGN
jgi:pimeloyl-ACP methyl ester carboxylesterase